MRKTDITVKWPAEVVAGKLFIHARPEFDRYIEANYEGKKVNVTLTEIRRQRSIPQNNYYWGVVIAIAADAMGCTPAEAHAILGEEFLKYDKLLNNGKTVTLVRSTSDLSTAEAEDYYRQCREFLSMECEAYVPLPNEVEWHGKDGYIQRRAKDA